MVSIMRTAILTKDQKDFHKFLENAGFSNFHLFPSKSDNLHLNIQFDKPAGLFNYKLRGVEAEYCGMHSNTYYYDLDQDIDSEVNELFGDDSDDY